MGTSGRTHLQEGLEDNFRLKLAQINVYIYISCVRRDCFYYPRFPEAAPWPGWRKPCVNSCSLLDRDVLKRCVSETFQRSNVCRRTKWVFEYWNYKQFVWENFGLRLILTNWFRFKLFHDCNLELSQQKKRKKKRIKITLLSSAVSSVCSYH